MQLGSARQTVGLQQPFPFLQLFLKLFLLGDMGFKDAGVLEEVLFRLTSQAKGLNSVFLKVDNQPQFFAQGLYGLDR